MHEWNEIIQLQTSKFLVKGNLYQLFSFTTVEIKFANQQKVKRSNEIFIKTLRTFKINDISQIYAKINSS